VTPRTARIIEAGDSALVLEIGATASSTLHADPEVNTRAIATARAVRQRAIAGVRDVVAAFRSVTVFFDPLVADVAAVASALHDDSAADLAAVTSGSSSRTIDVPVIYGGDEGPDLAQVAAFARCSPETVIERHAVREYRVFMLGFLPGFAYLAPVDETIAMPRRATPRLSVPAGSVGIAGLQTGVYPRDSPGGWQIIGRTTEKLFDPDGRPPALLAPGDHVRFVPRTATGAVSLSSPTETTAAHPAAGDSALGATRYASVLRPGWLTTIQDAGRWGYQDLGVPVSGPMDHVSQRVANALVGNPRNAATLEATWLGPELRMEQETRVAITGADLHAMLDGAEVPLGAAVRCRAGSVLRFGDRRSGARAYVAFDGGVAVPLVLGSRATHVLSGLGGIGGRALKAGDRVPLGDPGRDIAPRSAASVFRSDTRVEALAPVAAPAPQVRPAGGARLRVLPGPQVGRCAPSALEALQSVRFTVSPQSDRMGYRLAGGAPLPFAPSGAMLSEAAFVGGVQLPPSGDPILLMADRQTSGGYPQLAVVITADLPLAGQLGPGDWVEFEACSLADAITALIDMEGKLNAVG
jgi:antagonist of KipI